MLTKSDICLKVRLVFSMSQTAVALGIRREDMASSVWCELVMLHEGGYTQGVYRVGMIDWKR
jgi:hypothetical protein